MTHIIVESERGVMGMTAVTSVLIQTDPQDTLKMIRETLCAAQHAVLTERSPANVQRHADRLQRLIDGIDRQRPLGPDGKHDDRHTPTCGCIIQTGAVE